MPYFNSSAIKRAEYNSATGGLTIWFPEGKPYDYCNVPQHIWEGLCNAPSKGRYFNAHIDGRYQC
ncbi:KTSC domain-containing protein [Citromicrobium sp. JLT1363]|uniref:KTSC domain-containing protein n=1 Tax=Citromicrobium sp. JLT1363 TaxID=517722 RepID=UPI0009FD0586